MVSANIALHKKHRLRGNHRYKYHIRDIRRQGAILPLDIEKKVFPWEQGVNLFDNGSVYIKIPPSVLRDTAEWLGVRKEDLPNKVGWRLTPKGISSVTLAGATRKMLLEYELEPRNNRGER
jgi:hypothetical protein